MRVLRSGSLSGRAGIAIAAAAALVLNACGSPPIDRGSDRAPVTRPDARAEHAQHMEEAWRWLAARYDTDGDGQITAHEHDRGETAFRNLDRDGDGVVTRSDLARDAVLPPDLGIPLLLPRLFGGSQAEVAPIAPLAVALASLDRDGDGRVSVAEFRRAVGLGAPAGIDGFGTLLAGMDRDRDELLSAPEIAQWLLDRDADRDGLLAMRERESSREGAAPVDGWFEPEAREPAPDFAAFALADGAPTLRSALQQRRPMALIFGSFT